MDKLLKSKKGFTISDIPTLGIAFGTGVIVLSIISSIVGDVRVQSCETEGYYYNQTTSSCVVAGSGGKAGGGYSTNISGLGLQANTKLANWMPTIGLVLGAVIVIGALSYLFVLRQR